MKNVSKLFAVSAMALAVAACASAQPDEKTSPNADDASRTRDRRDSVANTFETTVARTYFYEPGDTRNVYWYEDRRPEVWTYRPVYRAGDRVYYIERDGNTVRRVYFDDMRARSFDWGRDMRFDYKQREKFRTTAQDEWARRERDEHEWRSKWDAEHRDEMR